MRLMIRITTAITSRMWMKPPIVYDVTRPRSQRTRRITKMVQSTFLPPASPQQPPCHGRGTERAVFRAGGRTMAIYSTKDFSPLLGTPGFSDALLKQHFELYAGYVKNANALRDDLAAAA